MSEPRTNHRNALQVLAPPNLTAAIKEAAQREMTTAFSILKQ
jgi:hypothetical protein